MTIPVPLRDIAGQSWRRDASCSFAPDLTLWDQNIHGETDRQKRARVERAKQVCNECPVAFECARDIDWTWDEGVRAGQLMPEKKSASRRVA